MVVKLLIYDPISRTGGGLAYIKNILPYLKSDENIEFVLYCNRAIKRDIENVEQNVKIIYSPKGSERGGIKAFWQRKKISKKEILKINPDVILYMNQIPVKLNIPSILFLRNALYFLKSGKNYFGTFTLYDRIRSRILRFITTNSIKKSSIVLTSSNSFAIQLKDWYRNRFEIDVVPFGTNSITKSRREKLDKSTNNLLVLQYNFYKGVEVAVYAFEIAYKINSKLRLTITDDLKNHKNKKARNLWKYIQKSPVKDYITCTGELSQEKLKNVYAKTDIFIFPSFVESFGHGILEAMNNGIPMILSDIPVFREIAGNVAVYFYPGDYKELSQKIISLSCGEIDIKTNVNLGYEIADNFSWKIHVEKLNNIAQILTNNKKSNVNETTIPKS